MRSLVIDGATEACSVALFDEGDFVAGACEIIGRGHAERLVPMLSELPGKGRADRIFVSLGPGSFTGVRIGLAAARALGLAWGVPVAGYPTLALVAAIARHGNPGPVTVCMTGGHGEWFVQDFAPDGMPEREVLSLPPARAVELGAHAVIAGSRAPELARLVGPGCTILEILPDARRFGLLPEAVIREDLAPLYGRPPDARLPVKA